MAYTKATTNSANFRIVLERHDVPPYESDLKGSWDGVFIEGVGGEERASLVGFFSEKLTGDLAPIASQVRREGGTSLWHGDLGNNPRFQRDFLEETEQIKGFTGSFGLGSGGALLAIEALRSLKGGKRISRRDFLKIGLSTGLMITGGYLAGSLPIKALGLLGCQVEGDVDETTATRAIKEATAKTSHLHPDETAIFLRNLIWAEKLEYLGELISSERRRKAEIMAVVGYLHAGVADMIGWGRAVRLFLLSLYQPFLPDIFKDPNDLRELCVLREVEYNQERGKLEIRRDIFLPKLVSLLDPERRVLGNEGQTSLALSEVKG